MYDAVIIGGGPAGYLAAERLGKAKKKTLVLERGFLGGTCLNAGCIPTKTLLNAAKLYTHAKEGGRFGVRAEVSYDWTAVQAWKEEVTAKLRDGVGASLKHSGVETVAGCGEISSAPRGDAPGMVKAALAGGGEAEYQARTILVCAGSVPSVPPVPGSADNPAVVDSTGLLSARSVPEKLVVIGGGVIGVEFAGLFSAFGSKVTVIEMMDEIIPFMDREQAPLFRRALKTSGGGVEFKLGCRVQSIEGAAVRYTSKDGGSETASGDLVLMAAGRRPLLEGWGAKAAGLDTGPRGLVCDERMRTNIPGIWAAGDVTGKSLLAHSAYRMADIAAADMLARLDGTDGPRGAMGNVWRDGAVPWAVYGNPEAAGVGLTEQEAAARGIPVLKASLPMRRSGRFAAEHTFAGQGAVKVLAHAEDRRILGVHAVGAYASEFIWGGAALIEQELRIEDVKQLIFPHPTVCELIRDAVFEL